MISTENFIFNLTQQLETYLEGNRAFDLGLSFMEKSVIGFFELLNKDAMRMINLSHNLEFFMV